MMCEECEEFPVRFVAYFNKPGGKPWRPSQNVGAAPWAVDSASAGSPVIATGGFACIEVPGGVPSPLAPDARSEALPEPES
jgi:hypothetical protein